MNKIIGLFLLFLVSSCQLFDAKVPDEELLLQQELQKINWKEVDQYPSFPMCDLFDTQEAQKACFFDTLIKNIQQRISADTLQIMYPEVDTINVKVTINPDATLFFETQKPSDSITYDIKIIDSILKSKLANFPRVEPAIKQGVKVKSQFVLPVIINVTRK